jgi:uncharacterized membrane protein YfcA
MPEPWIVVALALTGVLTGFIDAIAGGGGLLMMPALLSAGLPPHLALGTNKLQSMMGTTTAANTFWRHGLARLRPNLGTVATVFVGAAAGAVVVQALDTKVLQLVVPGLLLVLAVYVVLSPRMDDADAHQRLGARGYAPVAGGIGFYDGFFGPGTGTFFTASLVSLRGLGLTRATAMTKLLNATSNWASLLVFALGGKVVWLLGLAIGLGAMLGGFLGSHSAMRMGAKLIRPLLATISILLTARLVWQWFSG